MQNLKRKSQTHRNRIEKWLPEVKGWRHREKLVKEHKLSMIRLIRPEDIIWNVVTVVDNTVEYSRNLLK